MPILKPHQPTVPHVLANHPLFQPGQALTQLGTKEYVIRHIAGFAFMLSGHVWNAL